MTVKRLIKNLTNCEQREEVKICIVDENNVVWDILGISKDAEDNTYYIDCGWVKKIKND